MIPYERHCALPVPLLVPLTFKSGRARAPGALMVPAPLPLGKLHEQFSTKYQFLEAEELDCITAMVVMWRKVFLLDQRFQMNNATLSKETYEPEFLTTVS